MNNVLKKWFLSEFLKVINLELCFPFLFCALAIPTLLYRYLRQNPYQEDGSHIESFLLNENWEQYLMRMENPAEWCDHIVLKAAVDALALRTIVFNVYGNDIRRTEILPANCRNSSDMMTIYLGHLGEFHYLSLRPNKWDREWQKSYGLFLLYLFLNLYLQ